ncbi:MAG: LURP-one-related family protein [Promethearchaeota archaeon]
MSDSKKIHIVFLKKRIESFGNEEILNEKGKIIGTIIISFLKLNKYFKIQDLNTKKIIAIEKKNNIMNTIYNLKDKNDDLIATIRKNRFSKYPSKIWYKSKTNEFYAYGDFRRYIYNIFNLNDHIIAKVNKIEKVENIPKKIQKSPQSYYCLNFNSSYLEKILIIAFVICINILNNPSLGISDLMSFERKIARMRPFGPGKNLN